MNKIIKINIIICIFFAFFAISPAQASATSFDVPATLTLKEAVGLALERNLDILSAREERNKARSNMVYYKSALFPAINITGSATRRNETAAKPEGDGTARAGLSQYLYSGGVIQAGVNQADFMIEKADYDVASAEEDVCLGVYEAFYVTLYKKEVHKTRLEALNYYRSAAKELRARMELGLATRLDVTRMEQQLENARANSISSLNDVSLAVRILYTLLRLSPAASTDLVGELKTEENILDVAAATTGALQMRPDLKSLMYTRDIQAQNIEIRRAGMRPVLTLDAGYKLGYTATGDFKNNDEWDASLNLKIPVFDGGKTRGQVAQEEAIYRQAANNVLSREELIKALVFDAFINMQSVTEALSAAQKNLEMARESLRLAEIGYREGVSTQLDVLQTRTTLTEAEEKLSGYTLNYCNALARIWHSQGILAQKIK